ncbi:transposase (plasmid) [Sinorhizobium meliloti]|nr:transposase [Sinorhizobium meliloti]WQP24214.1 transposase [Sinorhizobium meliloti]
MAEVEILTGAERQRRWSAEQKLSILQEAFGPDGSVSVVARRHDILPQQIICLAKEVLAAQVGSSEERIVYPGFGYRAGEPGRRL